MQKIVGVKYNSNGKAFYFSPNGLNLKVGDKVIVETSNGNEFGIVDFSERTVDDGFIKAPLKPVLKMATESDENQRKSLDEKAKEAKKIIKECVNDLKLPMKITSASYIFDGTKILIEFTADDRVDFRELLKVLAGVLKVRIELRQIGRRDEVKNGGGVGICGQVCCCKRFLKDFEHVSVKMAKTQGVTLTPNRINGICGHLLCCLGYENKNYEEMLAKMPKINSLVETPKGRGACVFNDIIGEKVSVKFSNSDGSFTVEDFNLNDIKFKTGGKSNGIQDNR